MRLARLGYRSGTLTLPTREDAPVTWAVWRNQRTRWFKGWMQTWLVHTRHPARLLHDLGPWRTAGFLIVTAGMILSALLHPIYLTIVLASPLFPDLFAPPPHSAAAVIFWIGLLNLAGGYGATALLVIRSLRRRGRGHVARSLLWLPVYWLMMSVAAYRAAWHLAIRPFHWGKTPHVPAGSAGEARTEALGPPVSAPRLTAGPRNPGVHPILARLRWVRD